jgi:membrane protein YdbS with pleckstrin-like domain
MGYGERALKLMVVLLCAINCAVWLFYTESTFMAIAWGGIAIGFVIWIMDDIRRR